MATFEQMSDEQILAELAKRVDFLRRTKRHTDRATAERGGLGLRTLVAFRTSHKDITLTSFIKLLRGLGELERLSELLPPAQATYSPAEQSFVEPPRRIRPKRSGNTKPQFSWGDES